MIKNSYVIIIASPKLSQIRLDEVIGRRGLLVEDLSQNRETNRAALCCWKKVIWMNSCGSSPKNPYLMNRLNKVFLSVMLLLVSIVWLQYRRMERLTKERDRFSMNNTALLSDIKRIQSDSATMALDVKVLRLTMDEYKKFRTKDTEKIKELGMRIKHLEAAARHEVEVQAPIDAVIRDTFIVRDTIPLLRQKLK